MPPEGTVARTVHTLSEDQKCNTELTSRVKGAPWDFKDNAGDDVNDGDVPEREQTPVSSTDLKFNLATM